MAFQVESLTPAAQAKVFAASPQLRAARDANAAKPPPLRAPRAPAAPATPAMPAPAAPTTPSSSSGGFSAPSLPTADDIPGGTALEKVAVVVGILVLGLGLYSRVTGKAINLGLTGFTGTAPSGRPPLQQPPLVPTIAQRAAAVSPARVG